LLEIHFSSIRTPLYYLLILHDRIAHDYTFLEKLKLRLWNNICYFAIMGTRRKNNSFLDHLTQRISNLSLGYLLRFLTLMKGEMKSEEN